MKLAAAVAAGHPLTAETGVRILTAGGSAADAAVAMMLTSCVAEGIFTGLGGGGFATYYDAATGKVTCLDFFVAVPGLGDRTAGEAVPIDIVMGGQSLPYVIGAASAAVPGVAAGAHDVWRRWGRLPWAEVIVPSREYAAAGVPLTEQHSAVLPLIAPAMLYGVGASIHLRADGKLVETGDVVHFPGLAEALDSLSDNGPESFYTGEVAHALLEATEDGGALSAQDLAAYKVRELPTRTVEFAGATVHARGNDLDDLLGTLQLLPDTNDPVSRAKGLAKALRAPVRRAETTNLAAVDRDGNACVITTSLGLGAGVWAPGFGIHLNSMLGEGELVRDELRPGDRMASMMSPLIVTASDGPIVAAGAAGGSRIRPALVQTLQRMLTDGTAIQDAISAPRINAVPGMIRAEPGYDANAIEALRLDGDEIATVDRLDAYFGGVSGIGRDGAGADPRRGGVACVLSGAQG